MPFCQSNHGCPLGNIIPKWNDLVFQVLIAKIHFSTNKKYSGATFKNAQKLNL